MFKFHYEPKNFDRLYGMQGFSETLLRNHFTLYEGYVTNTNKLQDQLVRFQVEKKTETPEFAELKRRFGWEWNGMRLHEYYFGNLTKENHPFHENSKLAGKMDENFGSYENWERDFKSSGAMRGIGWIVLYYDTQQEHFFNAWVDEHDTGHLAGAEPLLIMDVFEHAFITDYGIKKDGYIEAFFNAICWRTVEERFDSACQKREREPSLN